MADWTEGRPATPAARQRRWLTLPVGVALVVGLLLGAAIGGAAPQGDDREEQVATARTERPTTTEAARSTTTTARPTTSERPTTTAAPTTTAPPTTAPPPTVPPESVSQSNARRSAANYLEFTAFSRSGLIEQLVFEGFTVEDATYGVDALNVDWNEQAAKKAAEYLEFTSFSRSGLIEQLVFEGFTPAEAEYGVDTTGL